MQTTTPIPIVNPKLPSTTSIDSFSSDNNNSHKDQINQLSEHLLAKICDHLEPKEAIAFGLTSRKMGLKGMRDVKAGTVDIVHQFRAKSSQATLINALNLAGKTLPTSINTNPLQVEQLLLQPFNSQSAQTLSENSGVMAAAFSPDGSMLVTSCRNQHLSVWTRTPSTPGSIRGSWTQTELVQPRPSLNIHFSPTGDSFVTTPTFHDEQVARLWSVNSQGQWTDQTLAGHTGSVQQALFVDNGQRIVTTSSEDGTARLWHQEDNQPWSSTVLFHTDQPIYLLKAVPSQNQTSDHQQLLISCGEGSVFLIDTNPDIPPTPLPGHQNRVTAVGFSEDGSLFITGSDDRTARVWQKEDSGLWTCEPLQCQSSDTALHSHLIRAVACRPDGNEMVTATVDGTLQVWSRQSEGQWVGELIQESPEVGVKHIPLVKYSPTGHEFVAVNEGRHNQFWSKNSSGEWQSTSFTGGAEYRIGVAKFSPDGLELLTSGGGECGAYVWGRSASLQYRSS